MPSVVDLAQQSSYVGTTLASLHQREPGVAHKQSSWLQEMSFSNYVNCHCFMQLSCATTPPATLNQINFLGW